LLQLVVLTDRLSARFGASRERSMARCGGVTRADIGFMAVIEPRVLQGLQQVVGADREDAAAAPTRDVSERVGEKGLADADRTDEGDVRMGVENT
jgi:hypothetical protein